MKLSISSFSRLLSLILVATLILLNSFLPTRAQDSTPQKIESDDTRVTQTGTWDSQASPNASGGNYLYSSGAEGDVLTLNFEGAAIEILYVAGPTLGTLAIEVDDTVLRTVITTSDQATYGQSAKISYLTDEPHTLRVYAQAGGVIAVDAFIISPSLSSENGPAGEVNGEAEAVNVSDPSDPQAFFCSTTSATHRVSLTYLGGEANNESREPSLSADGRYVAFTSFGNLVPHDTDGGADIYVYDRQTCSTELISISTAGNSGNNQANRPDISDDGRYVVFDASSNNLIASDTNSEEDVFFYDRETHTLSRISVATGGTEATGGDSRNPSVSNDGRYITFESAATNLVASDTNGLIDIFVHDRQTTTTTRISTGTAGAQATGGDSVDPSISSDGNIIAYSSAATNLVANDTNGIPDIFVRNRTGSNSARVSLTDTGAQATSVSPFGATDATLSADGRYVSFRSTANNMITSSMTLYGQVYVRDRQANTTTRVTVATSGTINENAYHPVISGDGRYVAYSAFASNIVANDTNGADDTFVYDRNTSTTQRISLTTAGNQSSGGSENELIAISANGLYVAYQSAATDLVSDDTNGEIDLFMSRISLPGETLALFNPAFNLVGLLNTLQDNPTHTAFTVNSAYAPITNGQWVMGDWDGDGLETAGVYGNGAFYYTNAPGEVPITGWQSLWIGVVGSPVAGRLNAALGNDCVGVVQSANFPPYGLAFVLYYTCDLSGNTAPVVSNQWLSVILPDSGGFTGTHQFSVGDFNSDGVESIVCRRGQYIAWTNDAPTLPAAGFPNAQFFGTPHTNDEGRFVSGNWDSVGGSSFGLYYQNGEFFYRNDLDFNSGVYLNQTVGTPFGPTNIQATSWR